MRRGDRFDVRKMTASDRREAALGPTADPGKPITLPLRTQGSERTVTLIAEAERFSPLSKAVLGAREGVALGFIAIGLTLLLRRPNRTTWGLFLYLVSATNVALFRFPVALLPVAQLASDILAVAGPIGLVIFAARFPGDKATGWRVWLDRLAIPVGALFVIPNIAWDATSLFAGGSPAPWMTLGSVIGALGLIAIAGDPAQGPVIQANALGYLASYTDPRATRALLSASAAGHPAMRSAAISALGGMATHDPARRSTLLAALGQTEAEPRDAPRLPPDARARCVGSVGPADRRALEASASYYQAMTVYCGAVLARAAD